MKAIIEVDIPDYQIGQEVSIYFKDTMMIKGIVQEPSGDLISRQDAIAEIYDKYMSSDMAVHNDVAKERMRIIKALPSVTPTQNCVENALGALDCISRQASEEDMSEVGFEIVKTEETKESGIKYLNINVSNSEVERNPDIVRLRADVGILEYVKSKTGHWIKEYKKSIFTTMYRCSECAILCGNNTFNYCPNCGAYMVEPQESEET